jgi:predicted cupin superfamily sugar epimerase
MSVDPDQLISHLQLKPHPEGGFYTETFRSPLSVEARGPAREQYLQSPGHEAIRSASTAIYFLLRRQDVSAFHSVRSDEVWHHYLGDALELVLIDAHGALRIERLGREITLGERPQAVAPRNVLQAARVAAGGTHGFALCGCTVAPGFDFADFEMPGRDILSARYPQHRALFSELAR